MNVVLALTRNSAAAPQAARQTVEHFKAMGDGQRELRQVSQSIDENERHSVEGKRKLFARKVRNYETDCRFHGEGGQGSSGVR